MKKLNILIVIFLLAPIFTFLLFSHNNNETHNIIYLHKQKNNSCSSKDLLHSLSNVGNIILVFYADWCNPCTRMSQLLEYSGPTLPEYTFIKINRDYFSDIADIFRPKGIPTLIFLRDGKEIGRYEGPPLTQKKLIHIIKKIYGAI
ncbi:MAG TPA: thioredoxin family protein [Candidatus Babeliales bacterium]|nr:thioredoxin family protein [Candidatus Babeliales bacterium]